MTPKEKAQELFDTYYLICQEFTEEIQCSIQAKQCALVAVNEILMCCIGSHEEYWQQVEHEIEKL